MLVIRVTRASAGEAGSMSGEAPGCRSADNSSLLQAAASMETVTMSGARGREEGASMEA